MRPIRLALTALVTVGVVTGTVAPALAAGAPETAAARRFLPSAELRVPNEDYSRIVATNVGGSPNATAARAALMDYLPGADIGASHVTPGGRGHLTISVSGDQTCLRWVHGSHTSTMRAGACTPGERRVERAPLTGAAQRLLAMNRFASLYDGPTGPVADFTVDDMAYMANFSAPKGVRITGITDVNKDSFDDDGRVAFRKNGRVVCAQLPLSAREKARIFYTGCRNLPARSTTKLATTYKTAAVKVGLQATAKLVSLQVAVDASGAGFEPDGYLASMTTSEVNAYLHELEKGLDGETLTAAGADHLTLRGRYGCSIAVSLDAAVPAADVVTCP